MGSVGVHLDLVLAGPEERIWVWEIALLKGEAGAHPIAVSKCFHQAYFDCLHLTNCGHNVFVVI